MEDKNRRKSIALTVCLTVVGILVAAALMCIGVFAILMCTGIISVKHLLISFNWQWGLLDLLGSDWHYRCYHRCLIRPES